MDTPTVRRLSQVPPDGFLEPSGVTAFRRCVETGGPTGFIEWRKSPYTLSLLHALRCLAMTRVDGERDVLLQSGMTEGLSLAAQLVDDPSVLWPNVFAGAPGAPASKSPEEDFNTSVDSLDDK